MRDTYTASNGMEVKTSFRGGLKFGRGGNLTAETTTALREFFQHERDKELGRWRSTIHPTWTAVVEESQGVAKFRNEDGLRSFTVHMETRNYSAWVEELREVAKEFFAAHPEPKPWHDAQPGEVWALEHAVFGETAWYVSEDFISGESTFVPTMSTDPALVGMGITAPGIKSARKIWPEVPSE